jgi:monoamine oxidase
MSRRSLLGVGGAAAAWFALGPDLLHAATSPPPARKAPPRKPPATIAIVGAGLGGLCAALTLHDAGVPATVYGVRQRWGSRALEQVWLLAGWAGQRVVR